MLLGVQDVDFAAAGYCFDGVEVAADFEHEIDGIAGRGDGVVAVGLDGHRVWFTEGVGEMSVVGAGWPGGRVVDEAFVVDACLTAIEVPRL